ncbi:hypothetical protein LTR62_002230 [Meristemomyces frigidus]|uniref:Zn(2)-C6 fungal-type domain-containing protein n=1 Tax=Meristemomyces frigidus TaxID=1508187 RepID=A0AAN7TMC5_9PEZI|nr:hypothetical protein LTR62_002230 [Meristemomyces frigidus]
MPSFSQHSHEAMASIQAQQDNVDRARAYKSRNKRPCDFCRYKKAACHLDSTPPCELCARYNKECKFVESPAKRRRPNDANGSSVDLGMDNGAAFDSLGHNAFTTVAGEDHHPILGWDSGFTSFDLSSMAMTPALAPDSLIPFDPILYQQDVNGPFDSFDTVPSSSSSADMPGKVFGHRHQTSSRTSPVSLQSLQSLSPANMSMHLNMKLPFDSTSGEPSLDNQASSNAQIVGMSGDMDPYLLSRFRYDAYNEASLQSIRLRKMNQHSTAGGTAPAFFVISHNALASKAQPNHSPNPDKYRYELEEMVTDEVGKRLIRLFYRYVQPYFPLNTREGRNHSRDSAGIRSPSTVPTCILAALYGHALPFCAWDEKLCVNVYTPPSADALFRLAWKAVQPQIHTPNLAVLQTLLLLIQRRPTNKHVPDTPVKWALMSTTWSVAQTLGLNRDPTDWPLPSWEIKVRKRLAWATYIQEKWLALNSGRASHISQEDWDVPTLQASDFADADREGPDAPAGFYGQHFVKLGELTVIVDEILRDLFSLKAVKSLQGSLEATFEAAKPLRERLTAWHHSLPEGLLPQAIPHPPLSPPRRKSLSHDLDGNGSLYLAYITAKISLFRAMLRAPMPAMLETGGTTAATTALRTGALTVAREVLDFLEGLGAKELEAFWGSYARTNFTIASSFILLLFVTAPTLPDAQECLCLLKAWRSLLRVKSRSCDLLNMALLRVDGVFVAGPDQLIDLSPAAAQAWAESEQVE